MRLQPIPRWGNEDSWDCHHGDDHYCGTIVYLLYLAVWIATFCYNSCCVLVTLVKPGKMLRRRIKQVQQRRYVTTVGRRYGRWIWLGMLMILLNNMLLANAPHSFTGFRAFNSVDPHSFGYAFSMLLIFVSFHFSQVDLRWHGLLGNPVWNYYSLLHLTLTVSLSIHMYKQRWCQHLPHTGLQNIYIDLGNVLIFLVCYAGCILSFHRHMHRCVWSPQSDKFKELKNGFIKVRGHRSYRKRIWSRRDRRHTMTADPKLKPPEPLLYHSIYNGMCKWSEGVFNRFGIHCSKRLRPSRECNAHAMGKRRSGRCTLPMSARAKGVIARQGLVLKSASVPQSLPAARSCGNNEPAEGGPTFLASGASQVSQHTPSMTPAASSRSGRGPYGSSNILWIAAILLATCAHEAGPANDASQAPTDCSLIVGADACPATMHDDPTVSLTLQRALYTRVHTYGYPCHQHVDYFRTQPELYVPRAIPASFERHSSEDEAAKVWKEALLTKFKWLWTFMHDATHVHSTHAGGPGSDSKSFSQCSTHPIDHYECSVSRCHQSMRSEACTIHIWGEGYMLGRSLKPIPKSTLLTACPSDLIDNWTEDDILFNHSANNANAEHQPLRCHTPSANSPMTDDRPQPDEAVTPLGGTDGTLGLAVHHELQDLRRHDESTTRRDPGCRKQCSQHSLEVAVKRAQRRTMTGSPRRGHAFITNPLYFSFNFVDEMNLTTRRGELLLGECPMTLQRDTARWRRPMCSSLAHGARVHSKPYGLPMDWNYVDPVEPLALSIKAFRRNLFCRVNDESQSHPKFKTRAPGGMQQTERNTNSISFISNDSECPFGNSSTQWTHGNCSTIPGARCTPVFGGKLADTHQELHAHAHCFHRAEALSESNNTLDDDYVVLFSVAVLNLAMRSFQNVWMRTGSVKIDHGRDIFQFAFSSRPRDGNHFAWGATFSNIQCDVIYNTLNYICPAVGCRTERCGRLRSDTADEHHLTINASGFMHESLTVQRPLHNLQFIFELNESEQSSAGARPRVSLAVPDPRQNRQEPGEKHHADSNPQECTISDWDFSGGAEILYTRIGQCEFCSDECESYCLGIFVRGFLNMLLETNSMLSGNCEIPMCYPGLATLGLLPICFQPSWSGFDFDESSWKWSTNLPAADASADEPASEDDPSSVAGFMGLIAEAHQALALPKGLRLTFYDDHFTTITTFSQNWSFLNECDGTLGDVMDGGFDTGLPTNRFAGSGSRPEALVDPTVTRGTSVGHCLPHQRRPTMLAGESPPGSFPYTDVDIDCNHCLLRYGNLHTSIGVTESDWLSLAGNRTDNALGLVSPITFFTSSIGIDGNLFNMDCKMYMFRCSPKPQCSHFPLQHTVFSP